MFDFRYIYKSYSIYDIYRYSIYNISKIEWNEKKMQSKSKASVVSCDNELYHYVKMIDFFQNQMRDPKKAELWKFKALNRLMELLKCTEDEDFVQNSLILLMAISNDNPIDLYSSRGVDAMQLSTEDREEFLSLMEAELLIN